MDNRNARIENGRLMGMKINQAFQVKLNDGSNPQISPTVDMAGMPIEVMIKLVHDALKVRGRASMRNMTVDVLKKTYAGIISWRSLYSKTGASAQVMEVSMSNQEKAAMILRLQADLNENQVPAPAADDDDDFDDEDDDNENDDNFDDDDDNLLAS